VTVPADEKLTGELLASLTARLAGTPGQRLIPVTAADGTVAGITTRRELAGQLAGAAAPASGQVVGVITHGPRSRAARLPSFAPDQRARGDTVSRQSMKPGQDDGRHRSFRITLGRNSSGEADHGAGRTCMPGRRRCTVRYDIPS
jgi:hypothetical protein